MEKRFHTLFLSKYTGFKRNVWKQFQMKTLPFSNMHKKMGKIFIFKVMFYDKNSTFALFSSSYLFDKIITNKKRDEESRV